MPNTEVPEFRPLAEDEVLLLHIMWQLEHNEVRITTKELADGLNWTPERVRAVVRSLKNAGYVRSASVKHGPGHPVHVHSLVREDLVDLPITAFLLLELMKRAESEGMVKRADFERSFQSGLDSDLIHDRIELLINRRYIEQITLGTYHQT